MALVSSEVVTTRRNRIIDFMAENRAFWKPKEVALELELTSKTTLNDFRALEKRGDLVKKESAAGNRYRLKYHNPKNLVDAGSPEYSDRTNLGSVAKGVASKVTGIPGIVPKVGRSIEYRLQEARKEAVEEFLGRLPPSLLSEIKRELEGQQGNTVEIGGIMRLAYPEEVV